jgi:hypothetical protein
MSLGDNRMTIAEWRDKPRARVARKYRNEPTVLDGMRFDSKAEARRYAELKIMEKAGVISDLQRQVKYVLIPAQARPSGGTERECSYIADFTYVRDDGVKVCEDVKGAATPEYRLKRKLILHVHGVEILETPA